MRRKIALALGLVVVAAALAPAAAAEQLHANVVSWSPNDFRPGQPVSVVLYLYTPGESPHLPDGKRVAGVNDVEVVLRGQGQTRRFATKALGGGRYGAEITFPHVGDWAVRVSYGPGRYGAGDEIPLGKGGACVAADCAGPQPGERTPANGNSWPWTTVALIIAAVLAIAGLLRFGASRGRSPGASSPAAAQTMQRLRQR